MRSRKKILLDMDGVIVDFVRGCIQYHNSNAKYEDITWNLEKLVRPDLEPSAFWDTLGYDFWVNLCFTPNGQQLIYRLENRFGNENIVICTSPCRTPGSIDGKIHWLQQNLPDFQRNFMVTPKKEFAASKDRVLIDDNNENCAKFREAGGYTVLVPQPWNARKEMMIYGSNFDVDLILNEVEDKLSLE